MVCFSTSRRTWRMPEQTGNKNSPGITSWKTPGMACFSKVWCPLLLQTTWNKTKVLFGAFILLFILWFRHHAAFFSLWLVSSILSVVSHALTAALTWHCCACSWGMTMPARCSLMHFFPGKAGGNLPFTCVVYLAESKTTWGRWVYSGRMVRKNDEPSRFCSVLSAELHHLPLQTVRFWHNLLPFLSSLALLI